MDASGPGSLGTVNLKEPGNFGHDVNEPTSLMAARRGDGVAVTRIAHPDHRMARCVNGVDEVGQHRANFICTKSRDDADAPWRQTGVELVENGYDVCDVGRRTNFYSKWVLNTREKLHVGSIDLTGPITNPELVGGAIVEISGERVAASQGFFVGQNERFVTRVEIHLMEAGLRIEIDTTRSHERQCAIDF